MTHIKVTPRDRKHPLGNHPVLFTEAILAAVIATLVDGQVYRVTAEGRGLIVALAVAMAAVAVVALHARYTRKAAKNGGGRANTGRASGDA